MKFSNIILAAVFFASSLLHAENRVNLAGNWRLALDPGNLGVNEKWFDDSLPGDDRVRLPGSIQEQGFGEDPSPKTPWMVRSAPGMDHKRYERYREPGNFKVPYWLTPEKYYKGVAWYQREIEIPEAWAGRRVALVLERPHWETQVWINGTHIGSNDSLSTPHVHELGAELPAGKHLLTIRVDNNLIRNVGPIAHSVTDHTQTNWNGMIGKLELVASAPVWIRNAQVYPAAAEKKAKVVVELGNLSGQAGRGVIRADWGDGNMEVPVAWQDDGGTVEFEIDFGPDARLWDEFNPNLYDLELTLEARTQEAGQPAKAVLDIRKIKFGLRDIGIEGTQITINGRKLFLRGTLECCIFPLTGYPPTDVESWKRIIKIAKQHGLNHIRFHSWCPPEAAFIAADELGFYYQVECAAWTSVGGGGPTDKWLYSEGERITQAYGNHPSFVMMAYGNEPGGGNHKRWLGQWVDHWKKTDSRRLHTGGAGWPEIPQNQYHNIKPPRISAATMRDGINTRIIARPPETRSDYAGIISSRGIPVVAHENGMWCVWPDFDGIEKFTGSLKPGNFEIIRDFTNDAGLGGQARDFLMASGKFQVLIYKEEIESALRTKGFAGFHMLDLRDFPGQGTALVGVLDAFWDPKPYISHEEFTRFCNDVVPLARMTKRVWTADETFEADVELAHFAAEPGVARASWEIHDASGQMLKSGTLPEKRVVVDNGIALGSISQSLSGMKAPARYQLVVRVECDYGTGGKKMYENDWDLWVYPQALPDEPATDVIIAGSLSDDVVAKLNDGASVLLSFPKEEAASELVMSFSTIFWNSAWGRRAPPHSMGILCDPKHPVFKAFPTEYYSNWQWWYLLSRASMLEMDDFPPDFLPLVQVVPDYHNPQKLGLVLEAKIGKGKLLVSSIDLVSDAEDNPVLAQFRHSLLHYMQSEDFNPQHSMDISQAKAFIK